LQQDQLSELVVDREHEVWSVHRHVVEARRSVPLNVLPAKVLAGLVIRQDRHRHSQVSSDHLHQSHAQENARVSHLLLTDEHSEGDGGIEVRTRDMPAELGHHGQCETNCVRVSSCV